MLQGKVAVVTGASSGIGRGLAEMLAGEGARVFAVGRNLERLAELVASGMAEETFAVDVARPDAARDIVRAAAARFGRVDVVCVNAGVYVHGDIWTNDSGEIRALIETNVVAAMDLVRAAVEHMREHGSGDILVTSSVSGHQAIEWEPVYSGSKHAMQAFVHGVRRQLVGSGVRISSLAPGIVLNELWQRAAPDRADPDRVEALAEAGEGLRVIDVADAARFILTRPATATVRDLVLLPTNQDI